jgi:hypothetical protein
MNFLKTAHNEELNSMLNEFNEKKHTMREKQNELEKRLSYSNMEKNSVLQQFETIKRELANKEK